MARRIIRKFILTHIAGVDRPAQEPSTVRIMKRADGSIGGTHMQFSKAEMADAVLEGAAVALRKREPHLTPEQAYAKVYTSPEYRLAAETEREASAARLAAAPVEKALSDADLLRLADHERRLNPSLSDREVYARVARSPAAQRDRKEFRGQMEAERRAEMMGKSDNAMDALNKRAAELRAANPELTAEQAFAQAYSDPRNRELAKQERRANRPEG